MRPDLEYETRVGHPAICVAGVDEVGRGCLAGPVVAAALILPSHVNLDETPWVNEIRDSKLLRPAVRAKLAPLISEWALSSAVGIATVEEIDEINIFQASHLAMIRAIQSLKIPPRHVLIDGKWLPSNLSMPATAIIKGDQKCLSIAAASIIAKEWRDQHMLELDAQFPHYGFAQHKGYPTAFHSEAIQSNGICLHHRKSFGPVKSSMGNTLG